MGADVAGVVLGAGAGTRLRPLTWLRPKALCPVGDRALVDHAVTRVTAVTPAVAVNVHHGRRLMEEHFAEGPTAVSPYLSIETGEARGTAGALGVLRDWIDGRPTLVTNADAWLPADLTAFVGGWDGDMVRLLCTRDPVRGDFGPYRYCGAALMPWRDVERLGPEPAGLYESTWAAAEAANRLDLVVHPGVFIDCGTVASYLEANLSWSKGQSVIGSGARVAAGASVVRSVVWAGSRVRVGERLVDAVRAGPVTVLVR